MKNERKNYIKIGLQIRKIRKIKGYTQEKLGEVSSLPTSYVSRIERGEFNISSNVLIKLALGLKVEIGKLFPELKELKDIRKYN